MIFTCFVISNVYTGIAFSSAWNASLRPKPPVVSRLNTSFERFMGMRCAGHYCSFDRGGASENNVENCFAVFLSRSQPRDTCAHPRGEGTGERGGGERRPPRVDGPLRVWAGEGDGVALCVPSITRTFSPSGYRAWPFLRAVHPARLQSRGIIESAAYLVRPD